MYPELVHIGPVTVHSFGVMIALAFVSAGIVTWWQLGRKGLSQDPVYSMLIGAIIGGIVGAKVHYLVIHPDQFRLATFSGRGLVWYGGLFGGALGVYLVVRFARLNTALVADAIAPALAVAYAVGRLGCLLNGDDYGQPTSLPWGMSFPQGDPPTLQAVHPTQLYEVLGSLAIFALLIWVLAPRFRRAGSLFWAYVLLAGGERLLVEFVRTNPPGLWGLTQQQWISLAMLAAGALGIWWAETRGRTRLGADGRPLPAVVPSGAGSAKTRPAGRSGGAKVTRKTRGGRAR